MEPAHKLPEDDQPETRPQLGVIRGGGEGGGSRGNLHAVPPPDDSGDDDSGAVDAQGLSARERANDRWGMPGDDSSSTGGNSESGGLFHADGDGDSVGASGLDGLESSGGTDPTMGWAEGKGTAAADAFVAAGGMYSGFEPKNKLQRFLGSRITKRGGAIGGVAGFLIGGSLLLGGISVGPLELIHLSHVLQQSFSRSDQESSSRLGKLFRYSRFAKTGDIGETRVTYLGSKIFGAATQQLSDAGIEFTRDKLTGRPTGVEIDQDKLSKTYPELDDMNANDAASFVEKQLGLPDGLLKPNVSSAGARTYTADISKINTIKFTRALTSSSLKVLNDNFLVSSVKAMKLAKFFNAPSLWHPFSRARAAGEQAFANKVTADEEKKGVPKEQAETDGEIQATQQMEGQSYTDVTGPVAEEGAAAVSEAKGKLSGALGKLAAASTFTGIACIVYNDAGTIAKADHYAVYLPAAAETAHVISAGVQARGAANPNMTAGDVTTDQIGAMISSLGNVWNSKPLKSLENPTSTPDGEDLPVEYQQAFSGKTGAQEIQNDAANSMGGKTIASAGCSTAGMIIQAVVAVGASIGSLVASGGLDSPGVLAAWGANAVRTGVMFTIATAGLTYLADKIFISDKLPQKVFSGPLGGSLLAYGSRALSDIASVSAGSISLLNNTTTFLNPVVGYDSQGYDDSSLNPQGTFARIFNINDYNSLAGHLASLLYTSTWSQKLSNVASGVLNIGSTLGGVFSSMLPKASAITQTSSYNWSFPQYGIPDSMLNDPDLEDPYANAAAAAQLLDKDADCGHGSCSDMIQTCFGDNAAKDVSGKWDVTSSTMVDTSSANYENAGCNDIGNGGSYASASSTQQNWQRIIMFVFDTSTMNAAACAAVNDDQACSDSGIGSGTTSGTGDNTGTPVTASGSAAQLATQLLNEWGKNLTGNSVVKSDLTATSQGQTITNSDTCGKTVSIDPDLLQVILTTTTKYKLFLENIISGHGCDQFLHPKGRASDIGGATDLASGRSTNFTPGTSGDDQQLDRSFYEYMASILPNGGEMGQDECAGRTGLTAPSGITFFSDTCTHQHIDMGNP